MMPLETIKTLSFDAIDLTTSPPILQCFNRLHKTRCDLHHSHIYAREKIPFITPTRGTVRSAILEKKKIRKHHIDTKHIVFNENSSSSKRTLSLGP